MFTNLKSSDQILRENIYIYTYAIFISILDELSIIKKYKLTKLYEKSHSDIIK